MPAVCYTVVPLGDTLGPAQRLVTSMSETLAVQVFSGNDAPAAAFVGDGALFVVDASSLKLAVHRIGSLCRSRPDLAIVAALLDGQEADFAELVRAGAHDFVSLPVAADELAVRLQRAHGALQPLADTAVSPRLRGFVYVSAAMTRLAAKVPAIAGCPADVLILGETGTGKEVCAQAIHYLSARASRPWVAVNCGAIPAELVENELFGHVKGAYTTALAPREGLVNEAEGGTLFLDDIDCLPMAAQAKLLRFLQEREYRQVGSNRLQRADVRVIAASNRNLQAVAQGGGFRQDLYFRLNVMRLNLPPLRDRQDDVAALAQHFVRRFAADFKRPVTALAPAALCKLLAYDWPGNVRELGHVLERAVLLCSGSRLGADDIEIDGFEAVAMAGDESFRSAKARVVDAFERGYLEQTLLASGGNVTHAARTAGKDRRAFFELIRKHAIEPQRFRSASV